jgi:hypothetical protein
LVEVVIQLREKALGKNTSIRDHVKKGVVLLRWPIAALSDYKNPAIRFVQEVYVVDDK